MKSILLPLLTCFSLNILSAATVIEDQRTIEILTPSLADRKTLKLRLDNGLEAYLISDPQTEKSGAVLSMRVGSWNDPAEHPGMAHFLEHMLFLGTTQYPIEGDFQRYVSDHGGEMNAFTTNVYTSYAFTINNNALEEGLDRFSSFFKDPLFNPSGVSRELRAIDQEYAKNLESDDIRMLYVHKALANPQHPNQRFGMGNSKSLLNTTQEALRTWYNENYSANLMRLMIVSPLPLKELEQLVVNDFSAIVNRNKQEFTSIEPSTAHTMKGKIVYIEPIKDVRKLLLVWELPPAFAEMKETKPDSLLCHVLGHEGQESILAELKRQKLADSLSCGGSKLGGQNVELFLEIGLTEKGLTDVNKVILTCFQTLALLKKTGVPETIFKEIQQVQTINYNYQQREKLFMFLMTNGMQLNDEALATYPEQSKIVQRYDADAINTLIAELTPERAHYYLLAPSSETKILFDKKEEWLQVPYAIQSIPDSTLTEWRRAEPNPAITLPNENPFIPKNLTLIETASTPLSSILPAPTIAKKSERGIVYTAEDTTFRVPKVSMTFLLLTPQVTAGDPTKVVLADLYVKALNDAFSPYSYPAQMAGFDYEVKRENNGIRLTVQGYSETADTLLKTLNDAIHNGTLPLNKFAVYKEMLLREYMNASMDKPWEQASELLKSILNKEFTLNGDKAVALRDLTMDSFQEYAKNIFSTVYIEGTIFGNIKGSDATLMADNLFNSFATSAFYTSENKDPRAIINLPSDKGPFMIEAKTAAQGNAALLAIETLPFSIESYAAQEVLAQALSEPFFNELRTRQQTGYIVFSTAQELDRHLFTFFIVQSNTHMPRDLLARFELFIESFLQELETSSLPKERFKKIKAALITKLSKPATTLNEMGILLNTLAFEYEADFGWYNQRIEALKTLDYERFLLLVKKVLNKNNKRRLAVLINGVISNEESLHFIPLQNVNELRKMSTFSGKTTPSYFPKI